MNAMNNETNSKPRSKRGALLAIASVPMEEVMKEKTVQASPVVVSSTVEETTKMEAVEGTSTPEELDAALTALYGWMRGTNNKAIRDAVMSDDPDRIVKVLKSVIVRHKTEVAEREKRIAHFRADAIEKAHQAFDSFGRTRASLEELVSWIGWRGGLDPSHASEYVAELEQVLAGESAAFSIPMPQDTDQRVIRRRKANGTETGDTREEQKKRAGRPPKTGATAKAPKASTKAKGERAPQSEDKGQKGPAAGIVNKALGWSRKITVAEFAKLKKHHPSAINKETKKADIVAAAKEAGLSE